MVLKLKSKQGTAAITKTTKAKGETIAEDTVQEAIGEPVQSVDPLAEVGVVTSYTHNLGDYNSCRVEVSIKLPSPISEIDETYEFAKNWCDERLTAAVAELQEG